MALMILERGLIEKKFYWRENCSSHRRRKKESGKEEEEENRSKENKVLKKDWRT